jgi:hypothetical protein
MDSTKGLRYTKTSILHSYLSSRQFFRALFLHLALSRARTHKNIGSIKLIRRRKTVQNMYEWARGPEEEAEDNRWLEKMTVLNFHCLFWKNILHTNCNNVFLLFHNITGTEKQQQQQPEKEHKKMIRILRDPISQCVCVCMCVYVCVGMGEKTNSGAT